jgi:hypothetical protein
MKIEGNAKNTHEELKKLYNTLGGDNLRWVKMNLKSIIILK